jgi:hypothetical protein
MAASQICVHNKPDYYNAETLKTGTNYFSATDLILGFISLDA